MKEKLMGLGGMGTKDVEKEVVKGKKKKDKKTLGKALAKYK